MKKIIVFTKKSSLNLGFDDFANKRPDIEVLKKGSSINLILFNEGKSGFEPVNDFVKDGLYLMYDNISEDDFNSMINGYDKTVFYILRHSNPEFSLSDFQNVAEGQHENYGKYYPNLIEILRDNKPNKAKRFFDSVFTFDAKKEALTNAIHEANNADEIEKLKKERNNI
ncbi:hypothetical protein AGMMS50262_21260 [Bacteroidia bacterium]|nr:hypothetical protein AGMMS50262_21260 [Bacteroidia bacterium]